MRINGGLAKARAKKGKNSVRGDELCLSESVYIVFHVTENGFIPVYVALDTCGSPMELSENTIYSISPVYLSELRPRTYSLWDIIPFILS